MRAADVVTRFVESQPIEMRRIVERLRKVVTSSLPGTQETIYHGALGYSPNRFQIRDRIVHIMPHKSHVTPGFWFCAHLPDPEHLMEGQGKRMKHVKILTTEQAGIKKLLREARNDAPASLASIHEKLRQRKPKSTKRLNRS